jgi:hypothetical protein
MNRFYQWMSAQKWLYEMAKTIIANRIVCEHNMLWPAYLLDRGWVEDIDSGMFYEKSENSKQRIWVKFYGIGQNQKVTHYYKVFYGDNKQLIALESTVEWFEVFYMLSHGKRGRYERARV